MAVSPEFRDLVLEMLEPLGAVSARAMFGGAGIYRDGTMFALIAADVLYFRIDEVNRPDFEAADSAPFVPFEDGRMTLPYWEVPPEVMEDPDALVAWAAGAWEAARRNPTQKRRRPHRDRKASP